MGRDARRVAAGAVAVIGGVTALRAWKGWQDARECELRRKRCEEQNVRVAVVGAGMSGICMAIKLQEAGIPFTILEQGAGFGGTWSKNSYPDAACDIPVHLYSFSFELRHGWGRKWAKQAEILAYLNEVAHKHRLAEHTRFGVSVQAASWDPAVQRWRLRLCSVDGGVMEETFAVFVPATGQLDRPQYPNVPGLEAFEGESWHTAEWPKEAQLAGKRVVGVGTGPSAVQAFPVVAELAQHLTVVQRSPAWVTPKEDFEYSPAAKAAFSTVPLLMRSYRLMLFLKQELAYYTLISTENPTAHSFITRQLRAIMMRDSEGKVPLKDLIPAYPPGCKRVAVSSDWVPMLARPNVTLETRRLDRVLPRGVQYADGTVEPCDVIIYATGFKSQRFLAHIDIRDGECRALQDVWDGVPRAYKGMCVPGFPNMFILYGPGTNLGHNSVILMIEAQVNYITRLLSHVIDGAGLGSVSVREDRFDADVAQLEADVGKTMFVDPSCDSWYKVKDGTVVNNWSGSCLAYWHKLRGLDLDSFNVSAARGPRSRF